MSAMSGQIEARTLVRSASQILPRFDSRDSLYIGPVLAVVPILIQALAIIIHNVPSPQDTSAVLNVVEGTSVESKECNGHGKCVCSLS